MRGRLGAAAHAELREHAPDVVLGGLRRNHEPVHDLGVRQPRGDQAQDLALARRELVALAPGRRATRDTELAQQGGSPVGVGAGAELLEGVARNPRCRGREGRATCRLDAREG